MIMGVVITDDNGVVINLNTDDNGVVINLNTDDNG